MNLMLSQPPMEMGVPVSALVSFDPPVVRPGELAIYRVNLNALEQVVIWPQKLAAPPELQLLLSSHAQVLQMNGGTFQPRTTFCYRAHPSATGEFTVPAFQVQVADQLVTVPAATLTVMDTPDSSAAPAQTLQLDLPSGRLFVGQSIPAKVLLAGTANGSIQSLSQVQLVGDGFLVDQGAMRQRVEFVPRGTGRVPAFIYETALTPLKPGKIQILAKGFTYGARFSGPIVIRGSGVLSSGLPQQTLLDSAPVELEVTPLPVEGLLPGFTGAIGKFDLDPPALSTDAPRVGDSITLRAVVRSAPSSGRLVAPPPPRSADWQVFADPANSLPPSPPNLSPDKSESELTEETVLSYTLIPLSAKVRATPAIPFSYFDPERAVYVDLSIPSLPIHPRAGGASAQAQTLAQTSSTDENQEPTLTLSGLAAAPGWTAASLVPLQRQLWFPLLQTTPGVLFLGLWYWDRRRRFFEQHPQVLLRRRALRALKRERRALRQAAAAGDASAFTSHAVGALRAACSPFYPAEPHALVGADILRALPASEQAGPGADAVRRLFASLDATRFSTSASAPDGLLQLQPDVESLLTKLEEELRK